MGFKEHLRAEERVRRGPAYVTGALKFPPACSRVLLGHQRGGHGEMNQVMAGTGHEPPRLALFLPKEGPYKALRGLASERKGPGCGRYPGLAQETGTKQTSWILETAVRNRLTGEGSPWVLKNMTQTHETQYIDSGQEGEKVCLRGRVGRTERRAKACLAATLHPTLGRIIQVMGHRWKHTFTATSTDRQTSTPRAGQQHSGGADWLLPASSWGHPHLPRIPRPGQTMSRGGCGEPAG